MSFNRFGVAIALLVSLVFLNACFSKDNQSVKDKANDVWENLYTPNGVVMLAQVERTDALVYAEGCDGVLIETAYGSQHSLAEIIEEYNKNLVTSGWQLNLQRQPNPTGEFAFYTQGNRVEIQINSKPILATPPTSIPTNTFQTIYSVLLNYVLPSIDNCIG